MQVVLERGASRSAPTPKFGPAARARDGHMLLTNRSAEMPNWTKTSTNAVGHCAGPVSQKPAEVGAGLWQNER